MHGALAVGIQNSKFVQCHSCAEELLKSYLLVPAGRLSFEEKCAVKDQIPS